MSNIILIIDNYDSFTYNLVQLIGGFRDDILVKRNDKISLEEIEELGPEKIIISPGPGRPESAGISLKMVEVFSGEIPILGICLGHQTIAAALGAKIEKAPVLYHGKTSRIINTGEGILKDVGDFEAARYHSLIVSKESLPDRFKITASTEDGLIMGIEDNDALLYGLQFHPESIMTSVGERIMQNFLQIN